MKILKGHLSPETAYVVDDYPYGFRLRCKIRYWLEVHRAHGVRLVAQTTNPKRGHAWNQPRKSTYSRFGGCLYLDEQGHVQHAGLSEYSDFKETKAWIEKYGEGNVIPETTRLWFEAKKRYEEARAEGKSMGAAAFAARNETLQLAANAKGITLPPPGVEVVDLSDPAAMHGAIARAVGEEN